MMTQMETEAGGTTEETVEAVRRIAYDAYPDLESYRDPKLATVYGKITTLSVQEHLHYLKEVP